MLIYHALLYLFIDILCVALFVHNTCFTLQVICSALACTMSCDIMLKLLLNLNVLCNNGFSFVGIMLQNVIAVYPLNDVMYTLP